MKIILRLGGHVVWNEVLTPNVSILKEYSEVLKKAHDEGHIIHIVIGGGPPSRAYINALTHLNASNALKDYVGAMIARANAYLIACALGELAHIPIPKNFSEVMDAIGKGKIVICGGLQPAQSTLAVAALLAELINADYLVNATTVDGVYTDDPKKNPNAKRLDKITISELRKILRDRFMPGTYELFDELSLEILLRSKIKAVVLDGRNPDNVYKLLQGERVGTLIIPQ
ncbi:MAG: UMP kinase [Thermoprotei archaeon]|nr:MAG: UMP kinase [Thermoprotei archaeon]RLF19839.1 MAG: UMP kinase [Thermoprotei archaeon]